MKVSPEVHLTFLSLLQRERSSDLRLGLWTEMKKGCNNTVGRQSKVIAGCRTGTSGPGGRMTSSLPGLRHIHR
jgi:hypothetical protein